MPFVGGWVHTLTTHAERATRISSFIGLNKGRKMNSLDLMVVGMLCLFVGLFIYAAYEMGYKVGLGEGYLRGRNIAKALKEAEAKR